MSRSKMDLLLQNCKRTLILLESKENVYEQIKILEDVVLILSEAEPQNDGTFDGQILRIIQYLTQDYFTNHQNDTVTWLVLWCILQLMIVSYSAENMFDDKQDLQKLLQFAVKQLSKIKTLKENNKKLCLHVMQQMSQKTFFYLSFALEDSNSVLILLFSTVFEIANYIDWYQIKDCLVKILSYVIDYKPENVYADGVSPDLLDLIIKNLLEPRKSNNRSIYEFTRDVIVKCKKSIDRYLRNFVRKKEVSNPDVVDELCEELKNFCPRTMRVIYDLLGLRLNSEDEEKQLKTIHQMSNLFISHDYNNLKDLWTTFLPIFEDKSSAMRLECVKCSEILLKNCYWLEEDIAEKLKARLRDTNKFVRMQVIKTIVEVRKTDTQIVLRTDLIEILKIAKWDKMFEVREVALTELAKIYHEQVLANESNVSEETKKFLSWIPEKVVCPSILSDKRDKILAEKLLTTYLVPISLPDHQRMKIFYQVFTTLSDHGVEWFLSRLKNRVHARKTASLWPNLIKTGQEGPNVDLFRRLLAKEMPDDEIIDNLIKVFGNDLKQKPDLLSAFEKIVDPTVSYNECRKNYDSFLEQFRRLCRSRDQEFLHIFEVLLERIGSVFVDANAIKILVGYVLDCFEGRAAELGLDPETALVKGLELLKGLVVPFNAHFWDPIIITSLLEIVDNNRETETTLIFSIFKLLGQCKSSFQQMSSAMTNNLNTIFKMVADSGSPKLAKAAILCLAVHSNHDEVFPEMINKIEFSLVQSTDIQRRFIIVLGCIAENYNMPGENLFQIDSSVRKAIEIFFPTMDDEESHNQSFAETEWCPEEELPEETKCRIEVMKCAARWSIGQKTNLAIAKEAFQLFYYVLKNGGNVPVGDEKLNNVEMGWLRLKAGCAMMKLCQTRHAGDQYKPEHLYALSQLMIDDFPQVRERFALKLKKGLYNTGLPFNCLSTEFLGIYALAGKEKDRNLNVIFKRLLVDAVKSRKDFVNCYLVIRRPELLKEEIRYHSPDSMLVEVVKVLAHDPAFTNYLDDKQHKVIVKCVTFVFQALSEIQDRQILFEICDPFETQFEDYYSRCEESESFETKQKLVTVWNFLRSAPVYTKAIYESQKKKR